MILSSYAPGDGSIRFAWLDENDRNGPVLSEHITESDVSEFLRQEEAAGNRKWKDWEIFMLHPSVGHFPEVCLVERVSRPFHTSRRVIFRGREYEYASMRGEGDECGYHPSNTNIWEMDGFHKHQVRNGDTILAICFFLNHEDALGKQGFTTRESDAGSYKRTVHDMEVPA